MAPQMHATRRHGRRVRTAALWASFASLTARGARALGVAAVPRAPTPTELVFSRVGLRTLEVPLGGALGTARLVAPACSDRLLDVYVEHAGEMEERTPYFGVVWPSAVALARHIGAFARPSDRVLELGCGLGLAGLAAALAVPDARVTLTDHDPVATALAARSAAANAVADRVDARTLDWTRAGAWEEACATLVLAADVIYEPEAAAHVATVLARTLRPGGRFVLADSETRAHRPVLRERLRELGCFEPCALDALELPAAAPPLGALAPRAPARAAASASEAAGCAAAAEAAVGERRVSVTWEGAQHAVVLAAWERRRS